MKSVKTGKAKQPDKNRRSVVAGLAGSGLVAGSGMLPGKWTKPVVETVILPAHATTSDKDQPSDSRLKTSVRRIACVGGIDFYRWKWNAVAERLFGLTGSSAGVIAQQVAGVFPDVIDQRDGYLTVDYSSLRRHLVG